MLKQLKISPLTHIMLGNKEVYELIMMSSFMFNSRISFKILEEKNYNLNLIKMTERRERKSNLTTRSPLIYVCKM